MDVFEIHVTSRCQSCRQGRCTLKATSPSGGGEASRPALAAGIRGKWACGGGGVFLLFFFFFDNFFPLSVFCHVKPVQKNLIGWGRAMGSAVFV